MDGTESVELYVAGAFGEQAAISMASTGIVNFLIINMFEGFAQSSNSNKRFYQTSGSTDSLIP